MRKKIVAVILLSGIAALYYSCVKTAPEPVNTCSPAFPGSVVTYNGYVSKIISTHCTTTCHNGSGVGPGNFTTYNGVLPYVSQFPYRVIPDNADMPQGNAPLPKEIRDSINIWVQNCAPEK